MSGCTGSNLRGQERKHFVVVPLDGDFRVKDMAPSIQAVKQAAANSNGAVGVGIVSMMGFEHTRNELSVRSSQDLWHWFLAPSSQVVHDHSLCTGLTGAGFYHSVHACMPYPSISPGTVAYCHAVAFHSMLSLAIALAHQTFP